MEHEIYIMLARIIENQEKMMAALEHIIGGEKDGKMQSKSSLQESKGQKE